MLIPSSVMDTVDRGYSTAAMKEDETSIARRVPPRRCRPDGPENQHNTGGGPEIAPAGIQIRHPQTGNASHDADCVAFLHGAISFLRRTGTARRVVRRVSQTGRRKRTGQVRRLKPSKPFRFRDMLKHNLRRCSALPPPRSAQGSRDQLRDQLAAGLAELFEAAFVEVGELVVVQP